MRPRPAPAVVRFGESLDRFAMSVISIEELWYGLSLRRSARLEAWLRDFLRERCEILPVSEPIARRAAELRARGRAAGRPRTQADMLIAATAWEHQCAIATRNVRNFDDCGVTLVNPFA